MKRIASILTDTDMPTDKFKKRKKEYENDLTEALLPGDIILYRMRKRHFFDGVVCNFTSSPYPHVEVHLENGYDIAATSTGVGYVDIFKRASQKNWRCDVVRVKKGVSREKKLQLIGKAAKSVLMPYDYANLIFFPFIKGKGAVRRAGNDAYICSELTAWLFSEIGIKTITYDRPEAIYAPADFGFSPLLDYVGTFEGGDRIEGYYRNSFLPEENRELGKLMSKFMSAFSKKDEFYAGQAENRDKLLDSSL